MKISSATFQMLRIWEALRKIAMNLSHPKDWANTSKAAGDTFPRVNRIPLHASFLMHFAEPAIWPSSIRTEDLTCANHEDVLTVRSVFPSNVHITILRGLPCRLESLRLKFTNYPSIFVDGDLAESIKRTASDRLGDLVPQVRLSPDFSRVFHDMALLGLCLELSFNASFPHSKHVYDVWQLSNYTFDRLTPLRTTQSKIDRRR